MVAGVFVGAVLAGLIGLGNLIKGRLISRSHNYEIEWPNFRAKIDHRCAIQWENEAFTLSAMDVHNDYLEDVRVMYKEEDSRDEYLSMGKLRVSESWRSPPPPEKRAGKTVRPFPIELRVNSIIRFRPLYDPDRLRWYRVYLDVRRKKLLRRVLCL